jgi:hypothetical protein
VGAPGGAARSSNGSGDVAALVAIARSVGVRLGLHVEHETGVVEAGLDPVRLDEHARAVGKPAVAGIGLFTG